MSTERATAESEYLLSMRGITKRFPGVVALDGVSLDLRAGEVLALMGENGAGKSTLMKVLGGAYAPDEGQVLIAGRVAALRSVRAAQQHGIALIHQELSFAPNLDLTANIFLGNELSGGGGLLRPLPRRALRARAREFLERVGLFVSPDTPAASLLTGQLQMLEIAKALALNARIIVMDEPTSSLTAGESEKLFAIVRRLRADGIGIIYISHRLDEVMQLADRITVLRDGRHAGDLRRETASHEALISLMVGREMSGHYFPPKAERRAGETVLEVEDVVVQGTRVPVSFSVRRGEILGFAGLVGAGRSELMCALFGALPVLSGRMTLLGKPHAPRHPRDAIERGVYLAPEDRKRHGLVLPMSIAQNTSLPDVRRYRRWGVFDRQTERRVALAEIDRWHIKARGPAQKVVNLSGGNQQKVVLGKWLAMSPQVLILDEPTRGIDVGAKAEIYRHAAELARSGIAILLVSSDMEEVVGLSDRVVVMRQREIRGTLSADEISSERIAQLMTQAEKNAVEVGAA
ncbi:MAG TPA: sugar ABC transporter ATP-binding protein [Polyangiaceae bacterium]|nr:sugar ABC transporter ATP-binding protein [Polyangiaceae bacterium]